jgi:hypothetical protein
MGIYPWNNFRYFTCEISFFSRLNYFYIAISVVVTSLVLRWIHIRLQIETIREMSLNTSTHNQHYVIEVFNLKRKDYTLFGWVYASILIKFSILIIFVHCCKYDMHNFTFSGWQTLPAAPLSSIARRFTRMEWNIQKSLYNKQYS